MYSRSLILPLATLFFLLLGCIFSVTAAPTPQDIPAPPDATDVAPAATPDVAVATPAAVPPSDPTFSTTVAAAAKPTLMPVKTDLVVISEPVSAWVYYLDDLVHVKGHLKGHAPPEAVAGASPVDAASPSNTADASPTIAAPAAATTSDSSEATDVAAAVDTVSASGATDASDAFAASSPASRLYRANPRMTIILRKVLSHPGGETFILNENQYRLQQILEDSFKWRVLDRYLVQLDHLVEYRVWVQFMFEGQLLYVESANFRLRRPTATMTATAVEGGPTVLLPLPLPAPAPSPAPASGVTPDEQLATAVV